MASRQDCINAAVRAGATPQEALVIVDNMLAEAKTLQTQGQTTNLEKLLAGRVMEAADVERLQTAMQRKQVALTIRKRAEADSNILQMMNDGASYVDAMIASMVGSHKRFAGARESVASNRVGIMNAFYGGILRELDEIDGALDLLRKDRGFGTLVHTEMLTPNSTGDATARQVAGIFSRYLEDMRVRLNDAGANVGKLENYAPQSHAPERLLDAGEQAWVDYVDQRLDWERSFPVVTDAAERRELLAQVYTNIVTGQSRRISGRERGTFQGPRNMARSLGQDRVLHFMDGAASLEYHERFGQGTIVQALVGQLDRMGKRLALMEKFGPNPESMIQSMIAGEQRRLRTLDPDSIRALARNLDDRQGKRQARRFDKIERDLDAARTAGDTARIQALQQEWENAVVGTRGQLISRAAGLWDGHRDGWIGKYYAVLSGETGTPVNPTAARIGANTRGVISMAKLGGAALSCIADVSTRAVNLRHNGENWLSALFKAWQMRVEFLQPHERKQFGRQLGLYSNTLIQDLNIRFDATDAPSGAVSRYLNRFFKLTGMEAWTEGHKAAHTMWLSNQLGEGARRNFADVNLDFGATLRRHGLDKRWDLIRKMAGKENDGEWHVLPERAYQLADADLEAHLPERLREDSRPVDLEKAEIWEHARLREQDRIRRDTATRVMGFYADETRYAVIEPDEKTRALMLGASRPGTKGGELRRFLVQFKSFPVAFTQRILREGRWSSASKNNYWDMGGVAYFAITSVAYGYLAMSAKDLSKGKMPRDFAKSETWIAALMQGGGAGIIGDFLLGVKNRFGGEAGSTLLGPGLSSASELLPISGQIIRGEFQGAGEDALRWGMGNTPYLNIWFTRAALDYLLLYHIREALSPGTLARTERKIKEEYNQTYILPPSQVIKRGGGFR